MRTKEECLSAKEYDVHYYGDGRKNILEAMDEYAREFFIAGIQWVHANNFGKIIGNISGDHGESLYNDFIKSLSETSTNK